MSEGVTVCKQTDGKE